MIRQSHTPETTPGYVAPIPTLTAFAFEGECKNHGPVVPLMMVPGVDIVLSRTIHDRSSSLETLEYEYYIQVLGNFNDHVVSNGTDNAHGILPYGLLSHEYTHEGSDNKRFLPLGTQTVKAGTIMAMDDAVDDLGAQLSKTFDIIATLSISAEGIMGVDSVVAVERSADEVLSSVDPDQLQAWSTGPTEQEMRDTWVGLGQDDRGDFAADQPDAGLFAGSQGAHLPLTAATLNEGLASLEAHTTVLEDLYNNKDIVERWTIKFDEVEHGEENAVAMYAFRNFKHGKHVFNLHDKIVAKKSFSYSVKVTDAENEYDFFADQGPEVFGVVQQAYPHSHIDRLVSFGDSNADTGNTQASTPGNPNLESPYQGVFCNGNVVAQNLAGPDGFDFPKHDLSRKCSKIGGFSYGYGGALISATNGAIPSLTDQISEHKTRMVNTVPQDNTLHTVTCGAGDIINAVNAAVTAGEAATPPHVLMSKLYGEYCYRKLMVQFRDEGTDHQQLDEGEQTFGKAALAYLPPDGGSWPADQGPVGPHSGPITGNTPMGMWYGHTPYTERNWQLFWYADYRNYTKFIEYTDDWWPFFDEHGKFVFWTPASIEKPLPGNKGGEFYEAGADPEEFKGLWTNKNIEWEGEQVHTDWYNYDADGVKQNMYSVGLEQPVMAGAPDYWYAYTSNGTLYFKMLRGAAAMAGSDTTALYADSVERQLRFWATTVEVDSILRNETASVAAKAFAAAAMKYYGETADASARRMTGDFPTTITADDAKNYALPLIYLNPEGVGAPEHADLFVSTINAYNAEGTMSAPVDIYPGLNISDADILAAALKPYQIALGNAVTDMIPKTADKWGDVALDIRGVIAPVDDRLWALATELVDAALDVAQSSASAGNNNKVLLCNSPNVGLTPEFSGYKSGLNDYAGKGVDWVAQLTQTFNAKLKSVLDAKQADLVASPNADKIKIYDLFTWTNVAFQDALSIGYNASVAAFVRNGATSPMDRVLADADMVADKEIRTYEDPAGSGVFYIDADLSIWCDSLHTSAKANEFIAKSMMSRAQLLMGPDHADDGHIDPDASHTWTQYGLEWINLLLSETIHYDKINNKHDKDTFVEGRGRMSNADRQDLMGLRLRVGLACTEEHCVLLKGWMLKAGLGGGYFNEPSQIKAEYAARWNINLEWMEAFRFALPKGGYPVDTTQYFWTEHGVEIQRKSAWHQYPENDVAVGDEFSNEQLGLFSDEQFFPGDPIMHGVGTEGTWNRDVFVPAGTDGDQMNAAMLTILGFLTDKTRFTWTAKGATFMTSLLDGIEGAPAINAGGNCSSAVLGVINGLDARGLPSNDGIDSGFTVDAMFALGFTKLTEAHTLNDRERLYRTNDVPRYIFPETGPTQEVIDTLVNKDPAVVYYLTASGVAKFGLGHENDELSAALLGVIGPLAVAEYNSLAETADVTGKFLEYIGSVTSIDPNADYTFTSLGERYLNKAWVFADDLQSVGWRAWDIVSLERFQAQLSVMNYLPGMKFDVDQFKDPATILGKLPKILGDMFTYDHIGDPNLSDTDLTEYQDNTWPYTVYPAGRPNKTATIPVTVELMVALGFVKPMNGVPATGPTFWKTLTFSPNQEFFYRFGADPAKGVEGAYEDPMPEWVDTPMGTITIGGIVTDAQLKAIAPFLTDIELMDPLFRFGQINQPYLLHMGQIETLVERFQSEMDVAATNLVNAEAASAVIDSKKALAQAAAASAATSLLEAKENEALAKAAIASGDNTAAEALRTSMIEKLDEVKGYLQIATTSFNSAAQSQIAIQSAGLGIETQTAGAIVYNDFYPSGTTAPAEIRASVAALGTRATNSMSSLSASKVAVSSALESIKNVPQVAYGTIVRATSRVEASLVKVVASLASAAEEQGKAEVAQATAGNADSTVAEALAAKTEARAAATACATHVTEAEHEQVNAASAKDSAVAGFVTLAALSDLEGETYIADTTTLALPLKRQSLEVYQDINAKRLLVIAANTATGAAADAAQVAYESKLLAANAQVEADASAAAAAASAAAAAASRAAAAASAAAAAASAATASGDAAAADASADATTQLAGAHSAATAATAASTAAATAAAAGDAEAAATAQLAAATAATAAAAYAVNAAAAATAAAAAAAAANAGGDSYGNDGEGITLCMNSSTGEVSVYGGAAFDATNYLETVSIAYNEGVTVNGNACAWSEGFVNATTALGNGSSAIDSTDTNTMADADATSAFVTTVKRVCVTVTKLTDQAMPTLHAGSLGHQIVVKKAGGAAVTYRVGDANYPLLIENL